MRHDTRPAHGLGRPDGAGPPPATVRRPRRRTRRGRLLMAGTALVLLAACGDADPEPGASDETGADEADAGGADEDGTDADDATGDDPADTGASDDPGQGSGSGDTEEDVEPVGGEPTTEPASHDSTGGGLTVTDVRVAGHDGFDRVVFELEGEGEGDVEPGWHVRYAPDGEPRAQGSGDPIEVEGEAALEIALQGFVLPFDRVEDVEAWDGGSLDGPDDGVVTEVVEDTIFEGVHTFVVGTSGEQPFAVEQLSSPDRIVLDVHHDGDADGS